MSTLELIQQCDVKLVQIIHLCRLSSIFPFERIISSICAAVRRFAARRTSRFYPLQTTRQGDAAAMTDLSEPRAPCPCRRRVLYGPDRIPDLGGPGRWSRRSASARAWAVADIAALRFLVAGADPASAGDPKRNRQSGKPAASAGGRGVVPQPRRRRALCAGDRRRAFLRTGRSGAASSDPSCMLVFATLGGWLLLGDPPAAPASDRHRPDADRRAVDRAGRPLGTIRPNSGKGHLMFACGGLLWASYTVALRAWGADPPAGHGRWSRCCHC